MASHTHDPRAVPERDEVRAGAEGLPRVDRADEVCALARMPSRHDDGATSVTAGRVTTCARPPSASKTGPST